MWIDSERESPLCDSWNHLHGALSSRFPLANHFAFPGSEPVFSVTEGPPLCASTSLSQHGLQRRGLWEGWHHPWWAGVAFLLAPGEPLCTCVVGKLSSASRMGTMWCLCLFFGQDSAPLCPCHCLYLRVPVHREQTWAAQHGAHLSPASVPLHVCTDHICLPIQTLGLPPSSAILNKAAMNIDAQVSVPYLFSVLLGIYPEMCCWIIW